MLHSRETINTNSIVFDLTRSGLKPTIYSTGEEHANHYTTERGMLTITPPQSTALERSMLTITPPQSTALERSMLTITPPM
jgi:hypothetical protein